MGRSIPKVGVSRSESYLIRDRLLVLFPSLSVRLCERSANAQISKYVVLEITIPALQGRRSHWALAPNPDLRSRSRRITTYAASQIRFPEIRGHIYAILSWRIRIPRDSFTNRGRSVRIAIDERYYLRQGPLGSLRAKGQRSAGSYPVRAMRT